MTDPVVTPPAPVVTPHAPAGTPHSLGNVVEF